MDWITVMFLSAVWTLILNDIYSMYWSTVSYVMIHFSKFALNKEQTHPHLGWLEGDRIESNHTEMASQLHTVQNTSVLLQTELKTFSINSTDCAPSSPDGLSFVK